MTSFTVPVEAIVPTGQALIQSALTNDFAAVEQSDGSFCIYPSLGSTPFTSYLVGTARIEDGNLIFDIRSDDTFGLWLIVELKKKFPEYNTIRVVWAIFYEWYEAYAMATVPSASCEGLIEQLSPMQLERKPVLCSFLASNVGGNVIETLTSQIISKDGRLSYEDKGPMIINLTCLENYSGPASC